MTVLTSEVHTALGNLGSTSQEIAQTLIAKGVKGKRQNSHKCPIAQYLRMQFPEVEWFSVSGPAVHIKAGRYPQYLVAPIRQIRYASSWGCSTAVNSPSWWGNRCHRLTAPCGYF